MICIFEQKRTWSPFKAWNHKIYRPLQLLLQRLPTKQLKWSSPFSSGSGRLREPCVRFRGVSKSFFSSLFIFFQQFVPVFLSVFAYYFIIFHFLRHKYFLTHFPKLMNNFKFMNMFQNLKHLINSQIFLKNHENFTNS